MAVTALVARTWLGVWGVRTMQARGFGSDQSENVDRGAGSIREAGGAFGKREQAEEERYFRSPKHPTAQLLLCHYHLPRGVLLGWCETPPDSSHSI
ncbi:ATPase inhibitor, mitochondrial isoform X2 [Papio anubis]|uniref:ATPase inhibitor, mitochondrial isoform X2 n=1 Tax=Papio anubis TaxID=9555 RepID=UPI0004F1E8A1|nr:ATPase inhibitor, mitochondrial isoform X2 [Papio anubis]XP_011935280.1 PREDICTED: ATPase inhibitor, mitochondrial isoform X3 [Cercocebus atys]